MPTTLHVLLTGGVGSRLWPLSRQSRPKQYLQIFSDTSLRVIGGSESADNCIEKEVIGGSESTGNCIEKEVIGGSENTGNCIEKGVIDGGESTGNCIEKRDVNSIVTSSPAESREKSRSLFELAVTRNSPFVDGLIVAGNKENCQLSKQGLKNIGVHNYKEIVEATPRNTAAAIAFAAFAAQPEDILLVTPADHIITEGEAYTKSVSEALELAKQENIVTFGVKPTRPETGYGYIQFNQNEVISFREKPDVETATEFLQQGDFLWNSGMFCFKAKIFLEELQKYSPGVYKASLNAWQLAEDGRLELESSLAIPSISVDYAVMEKSRKIKVVAADFEWNDMGSFEAVYDYLKEHGQKVDENGNMCIGTEKYTAFVGLQNSILVCTPDANLVLNKQNSQDVKKIYTDLETSNSVLI